MNLLRRASELGHACPVAFAVFAVLVGVASVVGTVLVVVRLAVEAQPECSVNVEGVPLAARSLLVEQRRRSSAARHHLSCSVGIDNCCSCTHLEAFHASTVPSVPAGRYVTSGRPGDIHWTSAPLTHR